MNDGFEYGPIARGVFIGLCWMTVLLGFVEPNWVLWHVCLLVFLGLCLKPLLVKSGLHQLWLDLRVRLDAKRHAQRDAELSDRIDRERRDARLRQSRIREKRLPPRW